MAYMKTFAVELETLFKRSDVLTDLVRLVDVQDERVHVHGTQELLKAAIRKEAPSCRDALCDIRIFAAQNLNPDAFNSQQCVAHFVQSNKRFIADHIHKLDALFVVWTLLETSDAERAAVQTHKGLAVLVLSAILSNYHAEHRVFEKENAEWIKCMGSIGVVLESASSFML